jgi:hypothetical protein
LVASTLFLFWPSEGVSSHRTFGDEADPQQIWFMIVGLFDRCYYD